MEYYKDLLVNKRNKFGIVFGIILLIFAFIWIIIKISENNLETFNWLNFSFYILNGIFWTLYGFGYQIEKLFFKAYIRINERNISVKTGIYEPKQEISWDEIQEIEYDSSKFILVRKDNSKLIFSIDKLEYLTIEELKETVNRIAKGKSIPYNA